MDVISHLNIEVTGFPYQKLVSLVIQHNPNEHAVAEVVGEVAAENASDIVQRIDEMALIKVLTSAEGQKRVLFCGCVGDITLEQENEYSRIRLRLNSLSRLIDSTHINRSYQNTAKTYGEILEKNIADIADLHMMVTDKPINALVMQYGETDWEFIKRMASRFEAPVVANVQSERAQIYIGLPPAGEKVQIDTVAYSYGNDGGNHSENASSMQQDFSEEQAVSYKYAYIGDLVGFNGKSRRIKSVRAYMKDGILQMQYGLLNSAIVAESQYAGIAVPKTVNVQASGKMMTGMVKEVDGDKVKVHLTEIDKEYDMDGDFLFPYSTAYSSSDGSGWYCMPEVDDYVRVFFPSGEEGEAFAASSVCAHAPSNPRNKSWKAPGGKEILLTDDGIYIVAQKEKIFINLRDADGIKIHANKNITIVSESNISLKAANAIYMIAENEMVLGTETSYMALKKDEAILTSAQIRIE